ncbi:MAG: OmpA family protein [Treponema sp.]|nr:OmpA family protein [Treponema sp.]
MRRTLALAAAFCAAAGLFAQESVLLRFKYKKDDNYRILSTVREDVKVNGRLNHRAEIVSRVTITVTDVDENGVGTMDGTFMTSEKSTGAYGNERLGWGETFQSQYKRDGRGTFDIADSYFMPTIRDMPIFPEHPVKVGDTWTASGYEAEDLRREPLFIEKPFKVPFVAEYEYLRDEEGISSDAKHEKKTFQVISVKYNIFYEAPLPDDAWLLGDVPASTMGYSHRTIWWDNEKGQIDHADEQFRIVIESARGNRFDFSGTTHEEITEFTRTATEENLKDVQEKITQMGLRDVSVTKSENGLTISLENIQFKPDSAELTESEMAKIRKIAAILQAYPDNDLLVSGHTALAGTENARQQLSEARAESVADFLVGLGVREKNRVFTRGFGARVPIASNQTEEGKAKNRRVEITILDK